MQVHVILTQALQLQAAVQENLISFAELRESGRGIQQSESRKTEQQQ